MEEIREHQGECMLKVVVFDSGWGGELVADFIEEELAVIEVIRVIDWRHAPYAGRTQDEMVALVEEALRPYWGRANVIVLGGWEVSSVRRELKRRHPQERFVGMRFTDVRTKMQARRALLLADEEIERAEMCRRLEERLVQQGVDVLVRDCQGWAELIDEGEMTGEEMRRRLELPEGELVDLVLIGNTHLWDVEEELRSILRWQVVVYDWRWELLHNLCMALGFRGADLRRGK